MRMKLQITLFIFLIFGVYELASAQEGPLVPCAECTNLGDNPFPETGGWSNPDQSGSGLMLEIQNGILAGYYFGYTENGEPDWFIFTGPLVEGEESGVQWSVESIPTRFLGGNCLGCDYVPPVSESLDPIKIEFLQRGNLKLTDFHGNEQYMVPIQYGTSGKAVFKEVTPYLLPTYSENFKYPLRESANFVLIRNFNSNDPGPWDWRSTVVQVSKGQVAQGGPSEGKFNYRFWLYSSPIELIGIGGLECGIDEDSGDLGCEALINDGGEITTYKVSYANITDSRFFGVAEDGSTLEGIRLRHD